MTVQRRWTSFLSGGVRISPSAELKAFGETVKENWHLGITCFGGPPVHFKIFHDKFVLKLGWISEQLYQELFSVCQALSGPASTKMVYCINLLHGGFLHAMTALMFWSIPGALAMFGLALGVSSISDTLPGPAYAVLSGLNAATVGVIALAAVQLSESAIVDPVTRIVVFLGAAAGLLYNALWYFPLLIAVGAGITIVHDFRWLHGPIGAVAGLFRGRWRRGAHESNVPGEQHGNESGVELRGTENGVVAENARPRSAASVGRPTAFEPQTPSAHSRDARRQATPLPRTSQDASPPSPTHEPRTVPLDRDLRRSWRSGAVTIALFFLSFIVVMVLRGTLPSPPLPYQLFANLYLAGTIIFGGGPVVIPLLREYVVAEGWVSPRDFLVGLAVIQGLPGPNFNFAVYLGALTARGAGISPVVGALIAWVAIFAPGLVLVHGTLGLWNAVRSVRGVKSAVRGASAAAVGLIYTAVYRLWQIGYLDEGSQSGTTLAVDPWWIVVTSGSYVGGYWFGFQPAVTIVLGAVMGLVWYGIVSP